MRRGYENFFVSYHLGVDFDEKGRGGVLYKRKAVPGQRVLHDQFPHLKLYVHNEVYYPDENRIAKIPEWYVTEGISGLYVAYGKSKKAAVTSAIIRIHANGGEPAALKQAKTFFHKRISRKA